MKVPKIFVAPILLAIAATVSAYDTSTHTAMTAAAAGKSRIGASPSFSAQIQTLGLRDYNFVLGDKYIEIGPQLLTRIGSGFEDEIIRDVFEANKLGPIQIPDAYTLTGWLMRGAIREDDNKVEIPPIFQDEPGGAFNRPFGHFHDPQNDRGLTVAGIGILPKATDWALTPDTSILGRQNHYKISDAREAMWRALTLKARAVDGSFNDNVTPTDWSPPSKEHLRKAYWATTFRALGDAVHLLQDMAQPQHTRNDMHSGLGCVPGVGPCALGHDSFFEKYLKARTLEADVFSLADDNLSVSNGPFKISLNALDYTSYNNIPSFSNYSDFFVSNAADGGNANGKGLANYSNRGFYSAGTNINRVFSNGDQPSPPPTGAGLGTVVLTDTGTNGEYLRDMAGNLLRGQMTFRTGVVRDTAGGADAANVKLSSVGAWDQFLQQKGYLSLYKLNYYNYDDQAKLLIPRAVAYSAGLIDYFFRGKLEIIPPDEGVYSLVDHFDFSGAGKTPTDAVAGFKGFKTIKLKLRNATPDITSSGGGTIAPQTMPGGNLVAVLKFYRNTKHTDDLTNELANSADYIANRSTTEEIVVSSRVKDAGGNALSNPIPLTTAQTFIFEFDQELPINATDVKLQVVYRGPLGSETDAVVVQTVDISEPTFLSYLNSSDYIQIGSGFYTRDQINANTPEAAMLRSQVQPPGCIDSMTNQLANGCFQPFGVNFPMKFGTVANSAVADIAVAANKNFNRIGTLIPAGANVLMNLPAHSTPCGGAATKESNGATVQTGYELQGDGTYVPLITTSQLKYNVRGIRTHFVFVCAHNGDGVPRTADLTQAQVMQLAIPADAKPLKLNSFNYGAP